MECPNWVRSADALVDLCKHVLLFCHISASDFAMFKACKTDEISCERTRHMLNAVGPNLSLLLTRIETLERAVDHRIHEPSSHESRIVQFADVWDAHVLSGGQGEGDGLARLCQVCNDIIAERSMKLKAWRSHQLACDEEHSSYSDYSESDTVTTEDSEEDSGGDEPDSEALDLSVPSKKLRYFRRRK